MSWFPTSNQSMLACRYIRNRRFSQITKLFRIYRHAGYYSGTTACRAIRNLVPIKITPVNQHLDNYYVLDIMSACYNTLCKIREMR